MREKVKLDKYTKYTLTRSNREIEREREQTRNKIEVCLSLEAPDDGSFLFTYNT